MLMAALDFDQRDRDKNRERESNPLLFRHPSDCCDCRMTERECRALGLSGFDPGGWREGCRGTMEAGAHGKS